MITLDDIIKADLLDKKNEDLIIIVDKALKSGMYILSIITFLSCLLVILVLKTNNRYLLTITLPMFLYLYIKLWTVYEVIDKSHK